jgi:hypothetical protein
MHILKPTGDKELCYSSSGSEIDASDSDDSASSVIKDTRLHKSNYTA